jgi:hypothetical protein
MKKIEDTSDGVADYMKYSSLEYIGKDSLISEGDATHTVDHHIYGGIKKISDISEYEHLYKIEK